MVRDEEDILEYFVRHHCTIVDQMVIMLHCCTDSSKEILTQMQREGFPVEIHESKTPRDVFSQGDVMTNLMHQVDADWIIPLDVDEFIGGDGFSRDTIEKLPTNVVYVAPWRTYVPHASDNLNECDPRLQITHRRKDELEQGYKIVFISKQMKAGSSITDGNHKVIETATGHKRRSHRLDNLFLAHFPIRSEQQLRRKIINGWESSQLSPDFKAGSTSFHWEQLYERCKDHTPINRSELQKYAASYALTDSKRVVNLIEDPLSCNHQARFRYDWLFQEVEKYSCNSNSM